MDSTQNILVIGDPVPAILACVTRLKPALLVLGEPGLVGSAVPMDSLLTDGPPGSTTRVLLVSDGSPNLGQADAAGGAPLPGGRHQPR